MRPDAVVLNVGRGPVIDEQALFDALAGRRIGGAIIDTWYQYPTPTQAECTPSKLDFASLPNLVMTPHLSGWTVARVQRRQQTMADNITRLAEGRPLLNAVELPVSRARPSDKPRPRVYCSGTPVLACSSSRVTPGAVSTTLRPCGVTSSTARSVMMRSTTPTPVSGKRAVRQDLEVNRAIFLLGHMLHQHDHALRRRPPGPWRRPCP